MCAKAVKVSKAQTHPAVLLNSSVRLGAWFLISRHLNCYTNVKIFERNHVYVKKDPLTQNVGGTVLSCERHF